MPTDDGAAERNMQDLHRTLQRTLQRMAESERRMEEFRMELTDQRRAFELVVANVNDIGASCGVGEARTIRPAADETTSETLREPYLPGTLISPSAGPICEATDTEEGAFTSAEWEVHEAHCVVSELISPSRNSASRGASVSPSGGKSRKSPSRGPSRLQPQDPGKTPQEEFMNRLEARALQERIGRGVAGGRSPSKKDVGEIENNQITASRPGFDRMRLQIHHTYSSRSRWTGTPLGHRDHLFERLASPFHPLDTFSLFWMCVLLVTSYISLLTLPYWLGFGMTSSGDTAVVSFFVTTRVVVYALDIAISFRTAYISEEFVIGDGTPSQLFEAGVVTQYSRIAKKYVSTWFFLDMLMLASAAFSMSTSSGYISEFDWAGGETGGFALAGLFKLPILFKAFKLNYIEAAVRLRKKASELFGSGFYRLFASTAYMSLMIHWVACIFHYIAAVNEFDEFTWVAANGLADAENGERYMQAIYWAITTLTTVGYGDISPIGIAEKIFTVLTMTLGIGFFAFLLSSMSALAVSLNKRHAKEKEWVAKMESFISRHSISGALAKRLLLYQEFLKDRALPGADQEVMENLSDTLRSQVDLFLNAKVIQSLPILACRPNGLLAELVKTFSLTLYAPGDIIMLEGDVSQKMHFICAGFVDVWISMSLFGRKKLDVTEQEISEFVRSADKHARPGDVLKDGASVSTSKFMKAGKLKHGDSFGCITCLNGKPRVCSISSTACTEVRVVRLADLNEIVEMAEANIGVDMLALINDIKTPGVDNAVDKLESSASKSADLHKETAMNLILKTAEKEYGQTGKMFSAVRGVTKWLTLRSKVADAVQQMSAHVKSGAVRKGPLANQAEGEQVEEDGEASDRAEGSASSWNAFLPG